MDNLCRSCRKMGEEYQLNSMMMTGLLEIYTFCTNIPISEDNEKCYKICEDCMDLLTRFNDFKKLCIESDNYFKHNVFVEIKIEIPRDPLQPYKEQTLAEDDHSVKDEKKHFYDGDNFDDIINESKKDQHTHLKSRLQCETESLKIHQNNKCENNMNEKIKVKKSKKIECLICSKKFLKILAYKNHMRMHVEEKPYFDCLYCDKKYARPNSLKLHIARIHLKSTQYSCHICPKICHSKEDLRRHLNVHFKYFECDLCGKKFTKKKHLGKHLMKNDCNMECNICKETFTNKIDYKNHTVVHFQENPYKCKICETNFIYLKSFKHHVKTNHPDKQNEDCIDDLQRLISVNDSLPSGIPPGKRKSKPESEKNFICNICGKRLGSKYSLDTHIRIHTGEKPFSCDKCDKKCRDKSQLFMHQKHIHEKMPKYNCSLCSYRGYTYTQLTKHTRTHTDDKPFICDVCDATFKMAKSLKVHKRSHTGERPYECTICNRKFASLTYLKQHSFTHTGEKPFACKMCDKKFSQRTPLIRHIELHKNGSKSIM